MTKRSLAVAVSWDDEVVTVADDRNLLKVRRRVIGRTYDGQSLTLPLPLTHAQARVKRRLGRLWAIPLNKWPWPNGYEKGKR